MWSCESGPWEKADTACQFLDGKDFSCGPQFHSLQCRKWKFYCKLWLTWQLYLKHRSCINRCEKYRNRYSHQVCNKYKSNTDSNVHTWIIFKGSEYYMNMYSSKEEIPFQEVQELKRDFLHLSDSLPLSWINGEPVHNEKRTEQLLKSVICRSDSKHPQKARPLSVSEKFKALWVRIMCPKNIIRPNDSSVFRNIITWCVNCHALHHCTPSLLLLKAEMPWTCLDSHRFTIVRRRWSLESKDHYEKLLLYHECIKFL